MLARIIRDDIEISRDPSQLSSEWLEMSEIREVKRNGAMIKRAFWKVGAILGGPGLEDCWMLVQMGVAEPADDECDAKSGRMTHSQLAAAQHAYTRLTKGVFPEDFAAYDAGEMLGYNPDGSWIKGPNYKEPEPETDEEDE